MRRYLLLLLGSFALVAAVGMFVTRGHPGLTVDSGEYVGVARNLAHGHGLTMNYVNADESFPQPGPPGQHVPLTPFPPMYPALIAGTAMLARTATTVAAGLVSPFRFAGLLG